jgi:glc operon protein GlcG
MVMNQTLAEARRTRQHLCAVIALVVLCTLKGETKLVAQEAPRERDPKLASDVKDSAGLFRSDAIAAARKELLRIERETKVATAIQTVESLQGKSIAEAASLAARQSGIHGIFVLIAKKETKIEILVSKRYMGILTGPRRDAIQAGFVEGGLRRRDFDSGLEHGVAAIAQQLAAALPKTDRTNTSTAAAAFGITTATPAGADSGSPLVMRNQVRLGLAGARAVIAGAHAKAQSMQLKVNIAVVDDGGHLLAFERMDGARPASGYTAITKATTAATFRQATGPLAAGSTPADPLLNLSIQNAAFASGGKITTLYGGVPVVVDGQIIGGVGVGGGTGEQDAQIARAGVQLLLDQLAATEHLPDKTQTVEKPE